MRSNRKEIFQEFHDPLAYYLCAYAMFLILRGFRKGQMPFSYKRFRYHFLFALTVVLFGDKKVVVDANGHKENVMLGKLRRLLLDPEELRKTLGRIQSVISRLLTEDVNARKYGREAERRSDFTAALRASLLREQTLVRTNVARSGRVGNSKPFKPSGSRQGGIIKRVGDQFGFITDESGRDVFFHLSQWVGEGLPAQNMAVTFRPVFSQRGIRALEVSRSTSAVS